MATTPSTRLRLPLQETGDNPNAWGGVLNGLFQRVDESQGAVTVAVNANVTLTNDNYVVNQARYAGLRLTGTGLAGNAPAFVTIPAVDKWRIVKNDCAGDIAIGTGSGVAATVRASQMCMVLCDGANTFVIDPTLDQIRRAAADLNLNGFRIINAADGVNPTDFATLRQAANTIAMDFANQAQGSATLAQAWAVQPSGEVATGQGYSALFNANLAKAWATQASGEVISGQGYSALFNANLAKAWATQATGEVVAGQGNSAKFNANLAQAWATQATGEVIAGQGFSSLNYAGKASASATLAQAWANQASGEVVPGQGYSAYYWAQQASTFAPPKATTAQAQAGTNDASYMTPLKTAQAIAALGAIFLGSRSISAADTIVASDKGKVLNLSGSFTLGATAAATLGAGFYCWLRKSDGNGIVTFDPNGAETVNGLSSINIYQEAFLVWTDGTSWFTHCRTRGWVAAANVSLTGQILTTATISAGFLDPEIAECEINISNLIFSGAAAHGLRALRNGSISPSYTYDYIYSSSNTSVNRGGGSASSVTLAATNTTAGPFSVLITARNLASASGLPQRIEYYSVVSNQTARGYYFDEGSAAAPGGIVIQAGGGGATTISTLAYTARVYRP